MGKLKAFAGRKGVVCSFKRYGIDALGAMASGMFCTLLVGTILNTIGQQLGIAFLNEPIVTIGSGEGAARYTVGGLASAMAGPGIAVAIGCALCCPPLVLFSLIPVGFAANAIAGAGGPLATCVFRLQMNGAPISSGMGTCGFVGQIGVYTGWLSDIASGAKAAITPMDWIGLVMICFVLPAVLSTVFCRMLRKWGWIREGDLKLDL